MSQRSWRVTADVLWPNFKKDFKLPFLGEQGKLRFGANIYNLTNTPHYGFPISDILNPDAGRIFNTNFVRQLYGDQIGQRQIMIRMVAEF